MVNFKEINKSEVFSNQKLYNSLDESIKFLENLNYDDFEYPKDKVLFHIYTDLKNEKELLSVYSFFATQSQEHCQLILWSDYNLSNNKDLTKFKDKIIFKIWNPIDEAKDTPLENFKYLNVKDRTYYLRSDLMRIMVIYKYGGIWIDMDIVLLRDFKPLFNLEFMYQSGKSINPELYGCCATVFSGNKKSEFTSNLIKKISETKFPPHDNSLIWGERLFSDLYKKYKFNILPSSFFDIDWFISDSASPYYNLCYKTLNVLHEGDLYLNCFSWHWHNSFNKNIEPIENSKFDKIKKHILNKL